MRVLHRVECKVCLKHKMIDADNVAEALAFAACAKWTFGSDGTELCSQCSRPATVSPGQVAS